MHCFKQLVRETRTQITFWSDLASPLAQIRLNANFCCSVLQDVSLQIIHMLHITCSRRYKHTDLPLHASKIQIVPPARAGFSKGGGSRLTFKAPQTVRALFLTEVTLDGHQRLAMRALEVKALAPRIDPLFSMEVVGLSMNNSSQQQ